MLRVYKPKELERLIYMNIITLRSIIRDLYLGSYLLKCGETLWYVLNAISDGSRVSQRKVGCHKQMFSSVVLRTYMYS